MKNIYQLRQALQDLKEELQEVQNMQESEVCIKYNVDFKREAIQLIRDEINYVTQDIEDQDIVLPYSYNPLSPWAGLTL